MLSKSYILVFACMLYLAQGSLLEELAGMDFHNGNHLNLSHECEQNLTRFKNLTEEIGEKFWEEKGMENLDQAKIDELNTTFHYLNNDTNCGPGVAECVNSMMNFVVEAEKFKKAVENIMGNYTAVMTGLGTLF